LSAVRRRADGPLALLLALGAVFVAGLALTIARQTVPYDPLVTCRTVGATLLARLSTFGTVVPVGVLSVVVLAAALAVVHQVWLTRSVLRRVLADRRPPEGNAAELARTVGLEGRLDVVPDDAVYTFCYGLRGPRVAVTTGLMALLRDDELRAVLRHEAHHLVHRDPLKILAGRAMASGLFFLPLAGGLRNGYLAGKELCADEAAAGAGDELPLARALVKLLHAERPSWPAGVLAIGALSATEARLQRLIEPQQTTSTLPPVMDWIVSAALIAGIFGFSHGLAAAAHAEPIHTACANEMAYLAPMPVAPAYPPLDGRVGLPPR
jgi:Zn-dependent protease with chaperone function